jgi:hypothetical protein
VELEETAVTMPDTYIPIGLCDVMPERIVQRSAMETAVVRQWLRNWVF